jgi:Flp pilus assembly protein TadG
MAKAKNVSLFSRVREFLTQPAGQRFAGWGVALAVGGICMAVILGVGALDFTVVEPLQALAANGRLLGMYIALGLLLVLPLLIARPTRPERAVYLAVAAMTLGNAVLAPEVGSMRHLTWLLLVALGWANVAVIGRRGLGFPRGRVILAWGLNLIGLYCLSSFPIGHLAAAGLFLAAQFLAQKEALFSLPRPEVALRGNEKGQTLVIFAALIPVIVLFFLFALGLAALLDVRAHAAYALGVAARAASRQVDYGDYGDGAVRFNDQVEVTARAVFSDALALRTTGLADTPGNIAGAIEVQTGYGSRDSPWESPFVSGRLHYHPTVAVRAQVPIRVWMFQVALPIISETEVK